MQSKSVSYSSVWLSLTIALLLLILFAFYYTSPFSHSWETTWLCQFAKNFLWLKILPSWFFQLLTLSQSYSKKKKKINSRNNPTNEMNSAWGLLNVSFSRKPALSLIYRSFECCKTSTALYSAKLTVNFIHNNRHRCHFDLDMSWNPISKFILLMDYYTPLLFFSLFQSDLTNSIQGEPPFLLHLENSHRHTCLDLISGSLEACGLLIRIGRGLHFDGNRHYTDSCSLYLSPHKHSVLPS